MPLLRLFLTLLLMLGFLPLAAHAEGEDDPLWGNPTYEKKVNALGHRILQANGIQENITFRVLRSSEDMNAFGDRLSGNVVSVNKGLLNYIESDDELAGVLGHEIAHITQRHWRKRLVKRTAVKWSVVTALTVAVLATDPEAELPEPKRSAERRNEGPTPLDLLLNPLYKKYETEADRIGLDYMVKAGYNPLSYEFFMTKLTGDAPFLHRIISTHPSGMARINAIRHHIATHYPQFVSPELAQDWASEKPQQAGVVYYPPSHPTIDAPKETTPVLLTQLAETTGRTAPSEATPTQTAAIEEKPSLAKTLLTLKPEHLTVLKALEARGYLEEDKFQEKGYRLSEIPDEYRETLLMDLARRQLVRVVGTEPDRVFLLTDWVSQELKQQQP